MTKVGFNNLPVDAEGVTFESYLPETEMEAKNLRVCRRVASATKERALMKHDGFIARLQREDETKQEAF